MSKQECEDMKRISRKDLATLKAGLAYYESDPKHYHCGKCPMSHENNRLEVPCYDFMKVLGGRHIFQEAAEKGYSSQHNVIKYLIKISYNRAINV